MKSYRSDHLLNCISILLKIGHSGMISIFLKTHLMISDLPGKPQRAFPYLLCHWLCCTHGNLLTPHPRAPFYR